MEETLRLARKHGLVLQLAQNLVRKRDFYAGGLVILFGLVMALKGPSYHLGTLMHMGPGFLPTALGVILIFLGILIAGTALATPEGEDERILPEHPEWFGWACILAGPLCFILFGSYFGMIPAIFTCVFVSALGDRTATLKSTIVLAAVVTAFGVGLFSYILQVPMPLLAWRGL
jgi:putative Ca2+/H+ antiporter (TMEM165/GDT1 family)